MGVLETAGSQKDRLQGLAKGRPEYMLPGGRPIASTPTIRGCSSPHEEKEGVRREAKEVVLLQALHMER